MRDELKFILMFGIIDLHNFRLFIPDGNWSAGWLWRTRDVSTACTWQMVYTHSLMTDALYYTHCLTSLPPPGATVARGLVWSYFPLHNPETRKRSEVQTPRQWRLSTTVVENGRTVTYQGQRIFFFLVAPTLGSLFPLLEHRAEFPQSVGLHGRVISSLQGLYLYTNTKHPCPDWDSNLRSRLPSERRQCTPGTKDRDHKRRALV
jgi:hypothetical protein